MVLTVLGTASWNVLYLSLSLKYDRMVFRDTFTVGSQGEPSIAGGEYGGPFSMSCIIELFPSKGDVTCPYESSAGLGFANLYEGSSLVEVCFFLFMRAHYSSVLFECGNKRSAYSLFILLIVL